MSLKKKILVAALVAGTVVGYGSGFAHLAMMHHYRHGDGSPFSRFFRDGGDCDGPCRRGERRRGRRHGPRWHDGHGRHDGPGWHGGHRRHHEGKRGRHGPRWNDDGWNAAESGVGATHSPDCPRSR